MTDPRDEPVDDGVDESRGGLVPATGSGTSPRPIQGTCPWMTAWASVNHSAGWYQSMGTPRRSSVRGVSGVIESFGSGIEPGV